MMRNLFLFTFLFFIVLSQAQKAAIFEGELLVQTIKDDKAIDKIVKDLSQYDLKIVNRISPILDIYHLQFNIEKIEQEAMLREVGLHSKILIVQNNHKTQKRDTIPNDTEFDNQWQYINNGGSGGVADADIDAELAWDITTGGTTPSGTEIVVCVIDDGLNTTHSDFAGNVWSNSLEFPNGIDDDGNGYIDDIDGWNAYNNNDNITNTGYSHGTAVACIVGCQGNNNNGVTGVNWDVKLMIVNGGGGEAQALAAYAYPHTMRKLYNETNGEKGAFVVATNASWGVDFGQPTQAPLWCAFYDTLGKQGILNAGATINDNVNVDLEGDLPTGCSSDYLITVTNLWRDDNKVTGAGYGTTTIDIGAHGQDTWTAAQFGSGYDGFGGTSGATPHVAGAIALLYSAPCSSFDNLYKTDPGMAALKAKEYIMEGADPNISLTSITVSESRLNLFGALTKLNEDCITCPILDISPNIDINNNTNNIVFYFDNLPTDTLFEGISLRYRVIGSDSWIETTTSNGIFNIGNLLTNTDYEYQFAISCSDQQGPFGHDGTFRITPSSVNDIAQLGGVTIYPNPNHGNFTIIFDKLTENYNYTIYDISGRKITDGKIQAVKQNIDLTSVESGVYIIKLIDKSNVAYTSRIIKL